MVRWQQQQHARRPPATIGSVSYSPPPVIGLGTAFCLQDCEERLALQAQMTTASSPSTRVWVYRNSILALPW